jgi:hypothetical protein
MIKHLSNEDGTLNLAGKKFIRNLYDYVRQIELFKARLTRLFGGKQ